MAAYASEQRGDGLSKFGFFFPHVYVLGICGVLFGGFVMQFGLNEFPCPLCMLQRYGMMLSAMGPMWVILRARTGRVTGADIVTGYGFSVLVSLLASFISARHILLHVNDPGYGSAVLGLHTYTWAWITFMVATLAASVMLLFSREFTPGAVTYGTASRATVWIFGAFLAANLVSVVMEQGVHPLLPGNPDSYQLWRELLG
ncbi:disulfide bond formation protein B [Streptomyces gamaensis]|uniref:Disulfide bond formation protein B n=1 Tax=Streptomyces gamaensis TaxID=1763542 RepID=A0ABW0ZAY1_9ACTN